MMVSSIVKMLLAIMTIDYFRLNFLKNAEVPQEELKINTSSNSKPVQDGIKIKNEEGQELNIKYEGDHDKSSKNHAYVKVLYCSG